LCGLREVPIFGNGGGEVIVMAQVQNTSVSLGEHFAAFIAASVKAGRYSSASDVVRAGLRLLEEQEAKLMALRQAIEEGEKSGYPDEPFDFDAFLGRMQEQHAPEV
jgi:antitoxin ParD1/3/4